jgi:hypothetical protein
VTFFGYARYIVTCGSGFSSGGSDAGRYSSRYANLVNAGTKKQAASPAIIQIHAIDLYDATSRKKKYPSKAEKMRKRVCRSPTCLFHVERNDSEMASPASAARATKVDRLIVAISNAIGILVAIWSGVRVCRNTLAMTIK